ncbi:MAG: hypothetical protein WCI20_15730 [bacterium]
MRKVHRVVVTASLLFIHQALAMDSKVTLINPTGRIFEKEPVRLQVSLPADAKQGSYVVRNGATEIPCQIEVMDGKPVLWIAAMIAPTGQVTYAASSGKPAATPAVKITKDAGQYVMDNGAVKVPETAPAWVNPVRIVHSYGDLPNIP